MHWIVANHKKQRAVPVSVAGNICRPIGLTTIELADPLICATDAELGRDG
jgi:hypothetical protein